MKLLSRLERRDCFLLIGLLGLFAGICVEYGAGRALIVCGAIALAFGLLGERDR